MIPFGQYAQHQQTALHWGVNGKAVKYLSPGRDQSDAADGVKHTVINILTHRKIMLK